MAAREVPKIEQGPAPATSTRRRERLTTSERRARLLEVGLRAFGGQAYDEIRVEDLAKQAGISTGLLYHYFPTKRECYLDVLRVAVAQIATATTPPADTDPWAALAAGVDSFLSEVERHPHGFLTAHRGALSADPGVQELIAEARGHQQQRILRMLSLDSIVAEEAVRGWIAMVYEVTANWLISKHLPRTAAVEILVGALCGSVQHATPHLATER